MAGSLVPLAVGTDLGGSITVPGSFCGVFGYKPSATKVAHSPRDALNLCTMGLFARSINDLMSATNIISKPDVTDWSHMRTEQIKPVIDFDMKSLCIGTSIDIQNSELKSVFDKIKGLWHTRPIDALQRFDLQLAQKIFSNVSSPVRLHQWQSLTKEQQSVTEKHTQKTAILAHVKSNLYHWLLQRTQFGILVNRHLHEFNVIVVPSTVTSAANVSCDITPDKNSENFSPWSTLCAVVGLPSVTVPVGLDAQGLPIAVMVIGPAYGDALVLQVAQAIQKQFPMPRCPVIL